MGSIEQLIASQEVYAAAWQGKHTPNKASFAPLESVSDWVTKVVYVRTRIF
jgi:hypothetical protein